MKSVRDPPEIINVLSNTRFYERGKIYLMLVALNISG